MQQIYGKCHSMFDPEAGRAGAHLGDDGAPGLLGGNQLLGKLGVDQQVLERRVALVRLVDVCQEHRADDAAALHAPKLYLHHFVYNNKNFNPSTTLHPKSTIAFPMKLLL